MFFVVATNLQKRNNVFLPLALTAYFQNTFSQEHLWKTATNCCDQLRYKLDHIRKIRS